MADIHELNLAEREAANARRDAEALAGRIEDREGANSTALAFLIGSIAVVRAIEAAAMRFDYVTRDERARAVRY